MRPSIKTLSLQIALYVTVFSSGSVYATNPDLVLPSKNDGLEQDAIVKDKLNREEASEDDAQNRRAPKKENNHTRVIPFYGGEAPPRLLGKSKKGVKQYEIKKPKQKYSGGFRIGPYSPGNLQGTSPGVTYQEIYGNSPAIMADFSIEYQFLRAAGKMGAKVDLGFLSAKGKGVFLHPQYNPGIGSQSDEEINLLGFPLVASLTYRAQFWDKQPIVPFAEGGAGYFTIFEIRGDKKGFDAVKYGGSPIAQVAGGIQIMLDGLDRETLWELYQEYGISHIYLTGDVRQIFHLGGVFDFSSLVYEGGFLFEF